MRLPRKLVNVLDLVSTHGVEVVDISDGSAASKSALRVHDIILSVNGRITADVDDLHRLLNQLPHATELILEVIRGESLAEVVIQ